MIVVMISVPSHEAGLRTMDCVSTAKDEGRILVEDVTMLYKADDGEVRVQPPPGRSFAGRSLLGDDALGPLVGLFSVPLVPTVAVGAGVRTTAGEARTAGGPVCSTERTAHTIRDPGAVAFLLVDETATLTMEQAGQAIGGSEAVVFLLTDEVATLTISGIVREAVDDTAKVDYHVLPETTRRLLRPPRGQTGRALGSRRVTRPVGDLSVP